MIHVGLQRAALVVALASTPAAASPPDAAALDAAERGRQAVDGGQLDVASEAYGTCLAAARAERVRWQCMLGMAVTESAAGRPARALAWYHGFLCAAERQPTLLDQSWSRKVETVRSLVGQLEPVALSTHARVTASSGLYGARIKVDGADPLPGLPLRTPCVVVLPPGEHVLAAEDGERVAARVAVHVSAGEVASVTIDDRRGDERPSEPDAALGQAGWGLVGAGVAITAAGAILTGLAIDARDDMAALDPSLGPVEGPRRFADLDADRATYATASWALYGVGAAAAVTGVILLVVDTESEGGPAAAVCPVGGGAVFTLSLWP